jgi:hypothetical protein
MNWVVVFDLTVNLLMGPHIDYFGVVVPSEELCRPLEVFYRDIPPSFEEGVTISLRETCRPESESLLSIPSSPSNSALPDPSESDVNCAYCINGVEHPTWYLTYQTGGPGAYY